MIIDFHTHCFPDKLAERAMEHLKAESGIRIAKHNGTIASLKENEKKDGVDKAVVLNIATNPKQQKNVNDFAVSLLDDDMLIPFGSVHPDSDNALEELERIKAAGIKGIKFHPDYQNFFVEEKKMLPIYDKISELGLITVFHSGPDIGMPFPCHCTAEGLKSILKHFKDTPVIAAHLGGSFMWPDVYDTLCGENLYFDTAFTHGVMPPIWAEKIIKKHGTDRILFGTDMPWSTAEDEMWRLGLYNISDSEKENILGNNARKLLGI